MSIIDQIREGDLVEAVKGKRRATDVATAAKYSEGDLFLSVMSGHPYLSQLEAEGWTFTVVEKATPPPPTEPGHYLDRDGDHWEVSSVHTQLAPSLAPYTRLEPVPDTVKRVADYLRGYGRRLAADDVEEHFGVTS